MPAIIQVSHLPTSASFYASITQPLGIHYLSSSTPTKTLNFGLLGQPPETLFSLTPCSSPKRSIITFAAPSPEAVSDFHITSLKANDPFKASSVQHTTDISKAQCFDMDGNMVEVIYTSPGYRAANPQATIKPASVVLEKEARRVLDWQEDVAKSVDDSDTSTITAGPRVSPPRTQVSRIQSQAPSQAQTLARTQAHTQYTSSPSRSERESPPHPTRIVRRETITTTHSTPEKESNNNSSGGGLSSKAIIGTLLGGAAGMAIAYAMSKAEDPEIPTSASYGSSPQGPAPPKRSQTFANAIETRHYEVEEHYDAPEPKIKPIRRAATYTDYGSAAGARSRVVESQAGALTRYAGGGGYAGDDMNLPRQRVREIEGSAYNDDGKSKAGKSMHSRSRQSLPAIADVDRESEGSYGGRMKHGPLVVMPAPPDAPSVVSTSVSKAKSRAGTDSKSYVSGSKCCSDSQCSGNRDYYEVKGSPSLYSNYKSAKSHVMSEVTEKGENDLSGREKAIAGKKASVVLSSRPLSVRDMQPAVQTEVTGYSLVNEKFEDARERYWGGEGGGGAGGGKSEVKSVAKSAVPRSMVGSEVKGGARSVAKSEVRSTQSEAKSTQSTQSKRNSIFGSVAKSVRESIRGESVYGSARDEVESRVSRQPTLMRAGRVPLPDSVCLLGDDLDSVVPSDSVSCVGSRRSGRGY